MDTKKIKQIIQMFEESSVNKMDLEVEDIKISLEKQSEIKYVSKDAPVVNEVKMVSTQVTNNQEAQGSTNLDNYVKAPFVGTYYAAASENSAPFVEVGKHVKKGDTLCIIEAMKVMNEIKADRDGVIKDIQASNGKMVEFSSPLMLIGE